MNHPMKKTITSLSIVTVLSFTLSFVFSLLAKETNYPQGIVNKVKNRVAGKSVVIDEEKFFEISKTKKLVVKLGSSNILVKKTKEKNVKVFLKGEANGFEMKGESVLKVERKDEEIFLSIDTETLKKKTSFGFTSRNLTLTIELPSISNGLSLDLSAGSGDLEIKDVVIDGLSAKAGSGDVSLHKVKVANVECATGSGDVSIYKSNVVNLQTRSGSGDLKITYSKLGKVNSVLASGDASIGDVDSRLNITTSSGDINIVGTAQYPDMTVRSSSGDVSVSLKKAKSFNMSLATSSGYIKTNVEAKNIKQSKRSLTAVIGNDLNRGDVSVSTSSGDITIL